MAPRPGAPSLKTDPVAPMPAGPVDTAGPGSLARALGGGRPPSSSTAEGLVHLVLTLVKLLHDLLERQAVRRMDAGALSDLQIEKLGQALFAQATELDRLRQQFGFSDADLDLKLGRPSAVT